MAMIFKIQRPLSSNQENPPALVYNKDRSILFEIPLKEVKHLFYDHALKVYVDCEHHGYSDPEDFIIKRKVENQDW